MDIETVKRSEQDTASEAYPSVALSTGERLHVFRMSDGWQVWLNTEVADFDGVCVASGDIRDDAVSQAVAVFEAAAEMLQTGGG